MPDFVSSRELGAVNLKHKKELEAIVGVPAVRWASRFATYNYFPGMLEDVYVKGYEYLHSNDKPAPVIAFGHKKFFDVQSIVAYMIGRPRDRFHDIVVISQAGVHSGVYPYREMVPGILKNPLIKPLAITGAKALGTFFKSLFNSINTYPVYRGSGDIPADEAEYEGPNFGGRRMLGLSYEEYLIFASKETRRSVMRVFQDMEEHNRMFILAPEGHYCHNGRTQALMDFMGVAANRKNRAIVLNGIAYDELCPDSLGRTPTYIQTAEPLQAPENKKEMPDFLELGRHTIDQHTPIVASMILGRILQDYRSAGAISQNQLQDDFESLCQQMLAKYPEHCAPILHDYKGRQSMLERFLRTKRTRRWLKRRREQFVFQEDAMAEFDALERTVDWPTWNSNQLDHRF